MSVNRLWPIVFDVTRLMLKVSKELSRSNPDEGGRGWATGGGMSCPVFSKKRNLFWKR